MSNFYIACPGCRRLCGSGDTFCGYCSCKLRSTEDLAVDPLVALGLKPGTIPQARPERGALSQAIRLLEQYTFSRLVRGLRPKVGYRVMMKRPQLVPVAVTIVH